LNHSAQDECPDEETAKADPIGSEESTSIMMTDEDGVEREFIVIASVSTKDANYILVADKERLDDDGEAVILREVSAEGDEHVYEIIEDDTEFEQAVALFQNSNEDYELLP